MRSKPTPKGGLDKSAFSRVIMLRSDAHANRRILAELRTDGHQYAFFEKHGGALTDAYDTEAEAGAEYETLTVSCANCLAPHVDPGQWTKL
jgi:hypothetical protein